MNEVAQLEMTLRITIIKYMVSMREERRLLIAAQDYLFAFHGQFGMMNGQAFDGGRYIFAWHCSSKASQQLHIIP